MNGTAPNPVTNAGFTAQLAKTIHRPAILAIPAFALKALYGEMAQMLVESQRIVPKAAESAGYRFTYPDLPVALTSILS